MDKIFLKDVNNHIAAQTSVPHLKWRQNITEVDFWTSQLRIFYILNTQANWKFAMESSTADENGVFTAVTDQTLWQPINLSDLILLELTPVQPRKCLLRKKNFLNTFVSTGTFSMF